MRRIVGFTVGLIGELWTRERRCKAHLASAYTYPPACASCGRRVH